MDAQKAMELAAKDEAEDVEMGAAEEEEDGQRRLEQGPPKAPAKVSSLQLGIGSLNVKWFRFENDRQRRRRRLPSPPKPPPRRDRSRS